MMVKIGQKQLFSPKLTILGEWQHSKIEPEHEWQHYTLEW